MSTYFFIFLRNLFSYVNMIILNKESFLGGIIMRKKLTIMVEEALTLEAKKKCLDKGISLSDLVNELIENYLNSSSNNDENNLK